MSHPNPSIAKIRNHVRNTCVHDHEDSTWDAIEVTLHPRVLEEVAGKIHLYDNPAPPGAAALVEVYRN